MNDFGIDALVFSPHPDDAEIFLGGTVAALSKQGRSVVVADLTRGELSTGGTLETRAKETAAASSVLQLTERLNLELPDGRISANGADEFSKQQVEALVQLLRAKRPRIVFAPSGKSRHPDHSATSALVDRAVFFSGVKKFAANSSGEKFTPLQLVQYQMRFLERPSFIVDTSATHETKLAAISSYRSQIKAQSDAPQDRTLLNSSDTLASISTRDAFYGSMIGTSYGEPFLCTTIPRVLDPVDYFDKHAVPGAQFFWGD